MGPVGTPGPDIRELPASQQSIITTPRHPPNAVRRVGEFFEIGSWDEATGSGQRVVCFVPVLDVLDDVEKVALAK